MNASQHRSLEDGTPFPFINKDIGITTARSDSQDQNEQDGQPPNQMTALPQTQPTPQAPLSPPEAPQLDNDVRVMPSSSQTHRNVILENAKKILCTGKDFLDALRRDSRERWGMESENRANRPLGDMLATRMSQLSRMDRSMGVSLQALGQMDDSDDSDRSDGGVDLGGVGDGDILGNDSDDGDDGDDGDDSDDDTVDQIRGQWSAVFGQAMAELALQQWAVERNDNPPQAPSPQPRNNKRTWDGMTAGQQLPVPATPWNSGNDTAGGVDGQRPVKKPRVEYSVRDTKPLDVPGYGQPTPGYRVEGVFFRQMPQISQAQNSQAPTYPTTPFISISMTGGQMVLQGPLVHGSQPPPPTMGYQAPPPYGSQPPPPWMNQPSMGFQSQSNYHISQQPVLPNGLGNNPFNNGAQPPGPPMNLAPMSSQFQSFYNPNQSQVLPNGPGNNLNMGAPAGFPQNQPQPYEQQGRRGQSGGQSGGQYVGQFRQ